MTRRMIQDENCKVVPVYMLSSSWATDLLVKKTFPDDERISAMVKWELVSELGSQGPCQYQMSARNVVNKKENFCTILRVRPSRADKKQLGLFAGVRFEKGDIVFVLEKPLNRKPNFTRKNAHGTMDVNETFPYSGCALDASELKGFSNNAILVNNEFARAIRRILPADEIFIDYEPKLEHPVVYMDCLVSKKDLTYSVTGPDALGKVTGCTNDGSGKVVFLIKFQDGSVERWDRSKLKRRMLFRSSENFSSEEA